jgi:hypothetical protein
MSDGGRLGSAGRAKLGQDVRDVHAGRLLADEQRFTDFAVGAACADEPEDGTIAQRVEWVNLGR